jgi:hypothetical protein
MANELLTVIGHFSQNLNYLAGAFFRHAYQERSVVLVGLGAGTSRGHVRTLQQA